MKSIHLRKAILATAVLTAAAAHAEVDLRTGGAAVIGPASVRFDGLSYGDDRLSVTVNLSANGTYSLSDQPVDTSGGAFTLDQSWVAITGPMSFRLFDVDLSDGTQVNATIVSDQLGVWRPVDLVPSRFALATGWADGGHIPDTYSCHGEQLSLPLYWEDFPAQTQSFAIVVEDADAKDAEQDNYVHWNLFNLPATAKEVAENQDVTVLGGTVGWNSGGQQGYAGPCNGERHRYYISVYALASTIQPPATELSRAQFESTFGPIILNKGEIMRYYP